MASDPLLENLTIDRGRIADLIAEGRLDHAAYRARHLADRHADDAGCAADARRVERLVETDLPRDRPVAWAEAFRKALAETDGSPVVTQAVRRYLARGIARSAEGAPGRAATVEGAPVGAYLLDADLPEEAAASLYAALATSPTNGIAALFLANALLRLGRVEEARDNYRRAFRISPLDLSVEQIADDEVRELVELADELEISGDVRIWLPAIGLLEDVLPFSALDPVPGAGFGDGTRAYDLLVAHKGARSHRERTAIRRDLRELAPALFDALLSSRKLDAAPTPTGTA
ncbi:tetratricopeptide repeat protein [Vulgatibacter incomptus]|nr:tetratricopeptide repeat protein [Vulgatibacter incomptus]